MRDAPATECDHAATVNPRSQLVLSLFPGIDLFGRAFEVAGFVVVRGPDLITGGDIRDFAGIAGKFDGVIGGPSCQGFSAANRYRNNPNHASVRNSIEMIRQFLRVVHRCKPVWWALENVPAVPDVIVPGFDVQRVPISDQECGGVQIRMRHIQFGHRDGFVLRPKRDADGVIRRRQPGPVGEAVTCKPASKWSRFSDQCRKQGLDPKTVKLPGMTKEAKFRAVGNAVPMTIGKSIANAVAVAGPPRSDDCPCGCGRVLTGKKQAATTTCRKRLQVARETAGGIRTRAVIELPRESTSELV
jgi:DNA (cytosine-5)-methyltransferase 1